MGIRLSLLRGPFQNNGASPWYAEINLGTPEQLLKFSFDTDYVEFGEIKTVRSEDPEFPEDMFAFVEWRTTKHYYSTKTDFIARLPKWLSYLMEEVYVK